MELCDVQKLQAAHGRDSLGVLLPVRQGLASGKSLSTVQLTAPYKSGKRSTSVKGSSIGLEMNSGLTHSAF